MLKKIVFITLSFCTFNICAQTEEVWNKTFDSKVYWTEVTSIGDLLVCSDQGLMKVNPENGEKKWSLYQFAGVERHSLFESNESPFYQIKQNNSIYLVDPFEGKIVLNSLQKGITKINKEYLLPQNNSLLLNCHLLDNPEPSAILLDLNSGKITCKLDDKIERVIAAQELTSEEVLIVTLFKSYKINSKTGKILWEKNNPGTEINVGNAKLKSLIKGFVKEMAKNEEFDIQFLKPANKNFYLLANENDEKPQPEEKAGFQINTSFSIGEKDPFNQYFNMFDIESGEMIWQHPLVVNGKLGQVYFDENGLLVFPKSDLNKKINKYDYKSRKGLWGKKGKGITLKGNVIAYYEMENELLLSIKNQNSYSLQLLNKDNGSLRFKKNISVDGRLLGYNKIPAGILYLTTEEINIVDPNTGKKLMKKSIETSPNLTAERDNMLYVFDYKTDGIKVIDKSTGKISGLFSDLKFKGKEKPTKLELFDNGISLFSAQNVSLYDYNGKALFTNYYPAPDQPGILKVLYAATAVSTAYTFGIFSIASIAFDAHSDKNSLTLNQQHNNKVAAEVTGEIGKAYGSATSMFFKEAFKRFKATQNGKDFNIILTEEDKSNYLIKVDKKSGKTLGKISIGKQKKPNYKVDVITGQIYLDKGSNGIQSYRF